MVFSKSITQKFTRKNPCVEKAPSFHAVGGVRSLEAALASRSHSAPKLGLVKPLCPLNIFSHVFDVCLIFDVLRICDGHCEESLRQSIFKPSIRSQSSSGTFLTKTTHVVLFSNKFSKSSSEMTFACTEWLSVS